MRIPCPHCGDRSAAEFTYRGDATPVRPRDGESEAWTDYVYLRDNRAGPVDELWWHGAGCRAWLVVTRDVWTHAITRARIAREVALERDDA